MRNQYLVGDSLEVLKTLPDKSVNMVFTSPPYLAVRDYGVDGQYGFGVSINDFINKQLLPVFAECKRVLTNDGTCWVNLGDSYGGGGYGADPNIEKYKQGTNGGTTNGRQKLHESRLLINHPAKSLFLVPERFAVLMEDELGWLCRFKVIWHKPNPMPDPFKDRPRLDYEHIYVFTKKQKYWFNYLEAKRPIAQATMERNRYAVGISQKLDTVRGTKSGKKMFAPIGGVKHAGNNGNDTYSGNDYQVHDGQAKIGSVWIWSIASRSFGYEYCEYHDRLVTDRDLLFKCQLCQTIYVKQDKCPQCQSMKRDRICPDCKIKVHQHFAMFPEELPEMAIRMACPDQVCSKCGKSRYPVYTPTDEYAKYLGKGWHDHSDDIEQGMIQEHDIPSMKADYRIKEWTKCSCNARFEPGIVLDPFAGFGTTWAAAVKLGRDGLNIDIDPRNAKAATARVRPMLNQVRLF